MAPHTQNIFNQHSFALHPAHKWFLSLPSTSTGFCIGVELNWSLVGWAGATDGTFSQETADCVLWETTRQCSFILMDPRWIKLGNTIWLSRCLARIWQRMEEGYFFACFIGEEGVSFSLISWVLALLANLNTPRYGENTNWTFARSSTDSTCPNSEMILCPFP